MTRKLIVAAVLAACAGGAAPATADVDREIVVRFAAPAGAEDRSAVRRAQDVRLVEGLYGGSQLVRVEGGRSAQAVADELEARQEVLWATPNFAMQLHATPSDARFAEQWALHNTGGPGAVEDADVDAPQAWDLTTGSTDVVVAILDSGTNAVHPDLAGRLLPGHDFVDGDADPRDEMGHGSATAGTAAARGNDRVGVTGVAQRASILPVRVADRKGAVPFDAYIQGLRYAAERAHVVNLSLGGPRDPAPEELEIVETFPEVLFVASAGNSGQVVDDANPISPCAIPSPNVVCVGASGPDDALASFSNRGAGHVDLVAPGVRLLVPRVFSALLRETFSLPLAGRWVTGGASPSAWGLTAGVLAETPEGPYANDTHSHVDTDAALTMDLTGREICRLGLEHTLEVADAGDRLVVEADDGADVHTFLDLNATGSAVHFGLPFGASVLGAPAVRLRLRFVSDAAGVAAGATIDDVVAECLDTSFGATSYQAVSGTSFSAPMVSGAAVLLKAREPGVTAAGMRAALLGGVDPLPALAPVVAAGGRLNAHGALLALDGVLPQPAASPADGLSPSGATLRGSVEDNGRPTTARFEYGTTTAYGATTPEVASADGALSAAIGGLAPGSTYHYRVVAESAAGTKRSADRTFTTPAVAAGGGATPAASVPPVPAPPPALPPRAAALRGVAAPAIARLRGRILTIVLANRNATPVTATVVADTVPRKATGALARIAARLGSVSSRLAAGRSATVRLRLSRAAARRLRRARRVRLRVVTRATGRAPVTVRRTVRLRR